MAHVAMKISKEKLQELFDEWVGEDEDVMELGAVGSDVRVVDFDIENIDCEDGYIPTELCGAQQIGDLSFIGVEAGGDWEYPVFFIIYLDQDGKTFRGYVPKKGNVWNWDTNAAFGNGIEYPEDKDFDFLRKIVAERGLNIEVEKYESNRVAKEIMFNREEILEDIRENVVVGE